MNFKEMKLYIFFLARLIICKKKQKKKGENFDF